MIAIRLDAREARPQPDVLTQWRRKVAGHLGGPTQHEVADAQEGKPRCSAFGGQRFGLARRVERLAVVRTLGTQRANLGRAKAAEANGPSLTGLCLPLQGPIPTVMERIPPKLEFADTAVPAHCTRHDERQSRAGHHGVDKVPFAEIVGSLRLWVFSLFDRRLMM